LSVNTKKTNVILGSEYHTLWGQDWLEETLCGHVFRLSVPSFFQINRAQTEKLYARALEFAGLTGSETVVDLYCGIGTISLTLAPHAAQVIGVEVVPQAIEDARENARRNGLTDKTRFECGDASNLAQQLEREGIQPDVVVVDPPRKGLAPDVVDTIARLAPDRVVYVSCDPATLARDVKRFGEQGYRAERAEAVDLFPRTAHVETVVLLSKGEIDS
jgi:23S rRNA (uracil1939-C5)-methyltransferase